MVTSTDINLGDNATIYYLKRYEDIIPAYNYQAYKNHGYDLVELTGKIIAVNSPDGKDDNGDLLRINMIFLITDEPIPFFTFFNKFIIEEYNYTISNLKENISWLGPVESFVGPMRLELITVSLKGCYSAN